MIDVHYSGRYNVHMSAITATKARNNFFKILENVAKTELPQEVLRSDGASLHIVSTEWLESLMATCELMSDSVALKELRQARKSKKPFIPLAELL